MSEGKVTEKLNFFLTFTESDVVSTGNYMIYLNFADFNHKKKPPLSKRFCSCIFRWSVLSNPYPFHHLA